MDQSLARKPVASQLPLHSLAVYGSAPADAPPAAPAGQPHTCADTYAGSGMLPAPTNAPTTRAQVWNRLRTWSTTTRWLVGGSVVLATVIIGVAAGVSQRNSGANGNDCGAPAGTSCFCWFHPDASGC
ncbi:hypothetical protein GE09DRAFT_1232258 [Coniochaeta sp. 2T2.1]|nr:hypothetical protein GE09DRAFT_1232258 [Coniochaeta sp. 2T2.1]